MKYLKYITITLIIGICILGTLKFVIGDTIHFPTAKVAETNPTVTNALETPTPTSLTDNYWNKVLKNFVSTDFSYLTDTELHQITINNWNETVPSSYFSCTLGDITISKKYKKSWKGLQDYGDFVCDEQNTITNEYSYVSLPITIVANDAFRIEKYDVTFDTMDFGLGCVSLIVFDENAKELSRNSIVAAKVNKPETSKQIFIETMEPGETYKTELVYVLPDDYIKDNYGYFFNMNYTGAQVNEPAQISLIKLPMGVENEKND